MATEVGPLCTERQRALIDARLVGHGLQRRVLHWREPEFAQLLQEDADRNLVQPADVMAGLVIDVDVGRNEAFHAAGRAGVDSMLAPPL